LKVKTGESSDMTAVETLRTMPFIGARAEARGARVVLFGCPFDSTVTFRPGARFGPAAIRAVSDVLETYCPILKQDLEDVVYADMGDLPLPPGDTAAALNLTYQMATHVLSDRQMPAALGGEHLLTLPLVRAASEFFSDLVVVQFDAHFDMRNQYLGVELSHSTVIRRIAEFLNPSRILQVGQRSGTREEFEKTGFRCEYYSHDATAENIRQWVGDRPIYVTVDLDVLDPSIFPGTGTPEPGGVDFRTLQDWLTGLAGCRWVGWDVMELSPHHDPTQISSVVAAKVVRTMILASTLVES
jgi:agmatinase